MLKAPVNDAAYIQTVASHVRKDLSVGEEEVVDFKRLIHRFGDSFVQMVTDLPLLDARGTYDELR